MPHSSSKSSPKSKSSPEGSTSTLTPQRKHRKLLKDGTSEVWPESLEEIFVQGLRQYWESPWATYSRGRSRWRNQFLVDYLQKAGIERSKKQIASHIQVLRNMWKGEPEFHLVAGGEELFLETGLLASVKAEESCDASSLIPFDESDCVSPSTPGFSPTEFIYEHQSGPSPPTYQSGLYSFQGSPKGSTPANNFVFEQDASYIQPSTPPQQLQERQQTTFSPTSHPRDQPNYSTGTPPLLSIPSTSSRCETITVTSESPRSPAFPDQLNILSSPARHPSNRICFLSLWADGMQPFTIPIQSGPLSPVALRIRLRLSSIDDIHSPPTLHGFHGAVTLAAPWVSTAQCITKVYPNNICVAEETGLLQPLSQPGGNQTIQAFLPESPLSRSRWLDATIQTSISQQLVIDDVTLALIVYDLDRRQVGEGPSADLVGMQRYNAQDTNIQPRLPTPVSSPSRHTANYSHGPHPPFLPSYSRRTELTSLSCALTPVNTDFHAPATSLLY